MGGHPSGCPEALGVWFRRCPQPIHRFDGVPLDSAGTLREPGGMARVRYVPPLDPKAEVERLRPALQALESWRDRYSPGGEVFWALNEAKDALDKVAVLMCGAPLRGAKE